MTTKAVLKEQVDINKLSEEAQQIIEILDQIETHTTSLREKLMSELKKSNNTINLKLDEV